MLKSAKWRSPTKVPVCVVEDHCEVLPFIYRLIGSKRLPLNNMALIHLDAHSDLSVPPIAADSVFIKEELFSSVSIESWILPMVYAGHISAVAWLTPPWTNHSFEAESNFHVGKDAENQQIRVTSADSYFLSELAYSSIRELTDCKPVSLHVMTLGDSNLCVCSSACEQKVLSTVDQSYMINVHHVNTKAICSDCTLPKCSDCCLESNKTNRTSCSDAQRPINDCDIKAASVEYSDVETAVDRVSKMLAQHCKSDCFILDVDLDFFSTLNPFLSTLTSEQYRLLSELYTYTLPLDQSTESIEGCKAERKAQLSYLKSVMSSAQAGLVPQLGESRRDELLRQLFNSIKQPPDDVTDDVGDVPLDASFDYDWLHEIGSGFDDCPLPQHLSSNAQILQLCEHVMSLIRRLPKPAAVTIARSSSDGYCPSHQVDFIQSSVIRMLESVYGDLDIKLNYAAEDEHS